MNLSSDDSYKGGANNNGSHSKKKDNLRYSRCEENHDEEYECDVDDIDNRFEEMKVIDFDQAIEVTSEPFLSSKNNIKHYHKKPNPPLSEILAPTFRQPHRELEPSTRSNQANPYQPKL